MARGLLGPEKELPVRPVLGVPAGLRDPLCPLLEFPQGAIVLSDVGQRYVTPVTSLLGSPGTHPVLGPVTVPQHRPPAIPASPAAPAPFQSPLE